MSVSESKNNSEREGEREEKGRRDKEPGWKKMKVYSLALEFDPCLSLNIKSSERELKLERKLPMICILFIFLYLPFFLPNEPAAFWRLGTFLHLSFVTHATPIPPSPLL